MCASLTGAWLMTDLKLRADAAETGGPRPALRALVSVSPISKQTFQKRQKGVRTAQRPTLEEPTACLLGANLSTILRAGADWNARRA